MKSVLSAIAHLFIYALMITAFLLFVIVAQEIITPNTVLIGPDQTHSVMPGDIFTGTDDTPVSFKGYCNFVLINTNTEKIITPEINPPTAGETENSYIINNVVLDDNYSVDLCGADASSAQLTIINITQSLSVRFLCLLLGVFGLFFAEFFLIYLLSSFKISIRVTL